MHNRRTGSALSHSLSPPVGFWRMLHFDYECQLLTHILSLVEENSWDFRRIPLRETLDTLENLEPRCALKFCGRQTGSTHFSVYLPNSFALSIFISFWW